MNIDAIRYFIAVVEKGNMSSAAEELHVTQPALSNSIRRMEKELGYPLFSRENKSFQLNERGKSFFRSAVDMLSIYEEGMSTIHQDPPLSGKLSIGYQIMTDSLLSFLADFHKQYPNITVSLAKIDLAKDDLYSLMYDFYVLSNPEVYGLSCLQIGGRHRLYALMRKDNPLSASASLSFSDLNSERIIFTIQDNGMPESVYQFCIDAGMKADVAYFCEDSFYQIELVQYTGAVAIVYNSFQKFRNSIDSLILVPINNGPKFHTKIYLAWKSDNSNAPAQLMRSCSQLFFENLFLNRRTSMPEDSN